VASPPEKKLIIKDNFCDENKNKFLNLLNKTSIREKT
jgi:hypothetical protein